MAEMSPRRVVSEMKKDLDPDKLEERLTEVSKDKPLVRHLLDLRVVLRALLFAAVVALLALLLFSGKIAGVLLLFCFFGAWVFLANRDYERRRAAHPAPAGADG